MSGVPVIVVTGAAGGLGSEVVRILRAHGSRIAAIDRVQRSSDADAQVLWLGFDISIADAWREALARIEAELGPVTGAALCAGSWQGGAPLHEQDDAVWRAMLHVNLETARVSLQALLPSMVSRRAGSIVLIGSRAVPRPWEGAGAAAYTASKAAVVALAQAVAAEVTGSGVRVNAVLPSTLDTAANRRAMPDADASQWVSPARLAELIAFLLSDNGRDITGAALPVYGRV
jgi:NAD(P)-dependent dehydrogenase (short-subunit alcohol dehydrogenase family)